MMWGSGHLKTQKIVPKNAKIADITHADTAKHTLDLAAALSETRKIIDIHVSTNRIGGTGYFRVYPNEGTAHLQCGTYSDGSDHRVIIANGTQRLQYSLTTANDDFDLFCFGYVVEA